VDIEDLKNAEGAILLDFVNALRTNRRTQLRRLTMKLITAGTLTGEKEKHEFSRFLRAFKEVPEFKDVRFAVKT
jgi:hypothetical protein